MIPKGFHRPKRGERCPVCQRPDWCLLADDGARALCKRLPSQARWGDAGWLHVIGKTWTRPEATANASPDPELGRAELELLQRQCRTAVSPAKLARFAGTLGLTVESLDRLAVGWSARRNAWTFPMTDAFGRLRGIRLRTDDGRKFSVKGGREGLFFPDGIGDGTLIVCEGPTSCAALLDLGFDAIGRPSCSGGTQILRDLLGRTPRKDVVILGDHDSQKKRPDGSTFRPGQDGAERLADELATLCRYVKVVVPPNAKDARDWKIAGATREVVEAVIRSQPYVRRRAG